MKLRLVSPWQKVGLICVGAISCPQVLLHSFLLLAFLLSPVAGAVDITEQLHRPLNNSVGRQSRDEADGLLRIAEQDIRFKTC